MVRVSRMKGGRWSVVCGDEEQDFPTEALARDYARDLRVERLARSRPRWCGLLAFALVVVSVVLSSLDELTNFVLGERSHAALPGAVLGAVALGVRAGLAYWGD